MVAENHNTAEVLDWLFKFQPDHPKHTDDRNHPRELAKLKHVQHDHGHTA